MVNLLLLSFISISEFYSSFETCQKELDHERQIKMEQLVSSSPSSDTIRLNEFSHYKSVNSISIRLFSSTTVEDYQKLIDQLTQNLSQKDEEQSLLRDHLNEVQVELRKTLDDHASTRNQYQSLLEQRYTFLIS